MRNSGVLSLKRGSVINSLPQGSGIYTEEDTEDFKSQNDGRIQETASSKHSKTVAGINSQSLGQNEQNLDRVQARWSPSNEKRKWTQSPPHIKAITNDTPWQREKAVFFNRVSVNLSTVL